MHASNDISQQHPIVLYDGECNLCNSAVQFIIRHERNQKLKFSPLAEAKFKFSSILSSDSTPPDAIHFVHKGNTLIESDAAIAITQYLKWPYSWIQYAKYIPKSIRDFIYRAVARRRLSMQSLFSKRCNLQENYSDRIV